MLGTIVSIRWQPGSGCTSPPVGGSSTKSLRPQPQKSGWLMAIFEKKSIYLKIVQGFSVLYHDLTTNW